MLFSPEESVWNIGRHIVFQLVQGPPWYLQDFSVKLCRRNHNGSVENNFRMNTSHNETTKKVISWCLYSTKKARLRHQTNNIIVLTSSLFLKWWKEWNCLVKGLLNVVLENAETEIIKHINCKTHIVQFRILLGTLSCPMEWWKPPLLHGVSIS